MASLRRETSRRRLPMASLQRETSRLRLPNLQRRQNRQAELSGVNVPGRDALTWPRPRVKAIDVESIGGAAGGAFDRSRRSSVGKVSAAADANPGTGCRLTVSRGATT